MKDNKYNNLFGDECDWIEDALRDYDVPDAVIVEIGAHFFVLQKKIAKLESEKANKRDIFAEIANEGAASDEEFNQFFSGLARPQPKAKKSVSKLKREPHFQSLKTSSYRPITNELISEMWPIGMSVEYTQKWSGAKRSFKRVGSFDLEVTTTKGSTLYGAQFMRNLSDFLNELPYDKKRKLLKRLLKNHQRNRDLGR